MIYSKIAKLPSFVNGSGPLLCVFPISRRDKYPNKHPAAISLGQERHRGEETGGETPPQARGRKTQIEDQAKNAVTGYDLGEMMPFDKIIHRLINFPTNFVLLGPGHLIGSVM